MLSGYLFSVLYPGKDFSVVIFYASIDFITFENDELLNYNSCEKYYIFGCVSCKSALNSLFAAVIQASAPSLPFVIPAFSQQPMSSSCCHRNSSNTENMPQVRGSSDSTIILT